MKLRVTGRISGDELYVYPHMINQAAIKSNKAVLKCHGGDHSKQKYFFAVCGNEWTVRPVRIQGWQGIALPCGSDLRYFSQKAVVFRCLKRMTFKVLSHGEKMIAAFIVKVKIA